MEKSIKRVEKLIHVTNSALAQMKFSLMFDDVDGEGKWAKGTKNFDPGPKFLEGDDLQHCQNEFQSEANEMLEKMETMLISNELRRKNSKAIDRIKEINRKMSNPQLKESKPEETEQSRKKLLSLISEEKFSPRGASSKESLGTTPISRKTQSPEKHHPVPQKTDSVLSRLSVQPKEELKIKILETEEIVNRGFQTARQLTQRVETISKPERKEKTPGSDKTVSETNTRSRKSESNETINTVKCRKCLRERRRKRETEKSEPNSRVIDVKREERVGSSKLMLQRLPSVHIKGGLQMQKVHSVEIPAGGEGSFTKSNTRVCFLSHEQVEKEKLGGVLETVKKEHKCCGGEEVAGRFVECFNCGKVIRLRETRVDPQKVDAILEKCNFNVFDPRIDEFVENYGKTVSLDRREEPPRDEIETTRQEEAKPEEEPPRREKRFRIQSLCDRLLKKYKEEADSIESNHLQLDTILQSLFRQVDESREVFEECDFLRNQKRVPQLVTTQPVVINLSATSQKIRRKRPTSRGVIELRHGTLDRRNKVEEGTKSAEKEEISCPDQNIPLNYSTNVRKHQEIPSPSSSSSTGINWKCKQPKPTEETITLEQNLSDRTPERETNIKSPEMSAKSKTPPEMEKIPSESSSNSSRKSKTPSKDISLPPWIHNFKPTTRKDEANKSTRKKEVKTVSDTSSDNNYESDFEPEENELGEEEEEKEEGNTGGNKLSTISEVDSELEVKLSEEQEKREGDSEKKTGEGSVKSTPTELVTSLKDVLAALQNQFARTESLAEKLTENAKTEKPQEEREGMPWQLPLGVNLVEGLRSARKSTGEKCRESLSEESPSEEGGSSLGEIKPRGNSVYDRRQTHREDVNIEEELYSEGEIPTEEFVRSKSGSVGEILTERNSTTSSLG